jgi:acetyl esterase/lipase
VTALINELAGATETVVPVVDYRLAGEAKLPRPFAVSR